MEKVIYVIAFLFLQLLGMCSMQAQTTGKVNTTTSHISSATSSTVTDGRTTSNCSVSACTSDDNFVFKASFDKSRTKEIRQLIVKAMGKETVLSKGKCRWEQTFRDERAYDIMLANGILKMSANKQLLPGKTFEKLKDLGDSVSKVLTNK